MPTKKGTAYGLLPPASMWLMAYGDTANVQQARSLCVMGLQPARPVPLACRLGAMGLCLGYTP